MFVNLRVGVSGGRVMEPRILVNPFRQPSRFKGWSLEYYY